jgi:heme exporter protein D
MSFMEFVDMGGYSGFVWPAYLITAIVLIINLMLPRIRHRRQRESVAAQPQKDPATGG